MNVGQSKELSKRPKQASQTHNIAKQHTAHSSNRRTAATDAQQQIQFRRHRRVPHGSGVTDGRVVECIGDVT